MMEPSRVLRTLCGVVAVSVVFAACSSASDDAATDESAVVTNEAPATAGDTTAGDTTAETAPPETAPPETAPPETAGSIVRVSGGTTDPWEIAGFCEWTPDNTSAASSLYVVEDVDDTREEEITILQAWPFQLEEDSEPVVIGSLLEPGGNLLTVLDVDASFEGGVITLLADVHNGIKTLDDPPDFTLTITCTP